MIRQIILFILGILISSTSLMFIIIYLNLLKMGFSFIEYIKYILTHLECLMLILGILLIKLSLKKCINKI
jgi:hypothetical protein